jgi:hypothetical protein
MYLAGSADSKMTLSRVRVERNGDEGIYVSGGSATISNATIVKNTGSGVVAYAFVTGGPPKVSIEKSVVAHNLNGIEAVGASLVHARDNLVTGNSNSGIQALALGAAVVASGNEISMNGKGFYAQIGGQIFTMSNNVVRDNGTNIDTDNGGPFQLTFD